MLSTARLEEEEEGGGSRPWGVWLKGVVALVIFNQDESADNLWYACFSPRVFQAWSSLTISHHLRDTCDARTNVLGSSTNSRICSTSSAVPTHIGHEILRRTRKQSSLGKTRNGSFFSLGLTNPCKKLSRLLSHVSTSDANQVSLSATLS